MTPRLPLLFRAPSVAARKGQTFPRRPVHCPGPATQAGRLDAKFAAVSAALRAERIEIRGAPEALEPQSILVLKIAGDVARFANAVRRISGLEYLGEQLLGTVDPDENFYEEGSEGEARPYSSYRYLIATNASAWKEVLSLWQRYKKKENPPHGFAPLWQLFNHLEELREWSDHDRLTVAGAADVWKELSWLGEQLEPVEIELWYRRDANLRSAAVNALREDLERVGGYLKDECILPEIDYHGVLAYVPAANLREAASNRSVAWMRTGPVRFFHPSGQMATHVPRDADQGVARNIASPLLDRSPRIALLDGLPLGSHEALDGRVVIDDPDDVSSVITVAERRHGTMMASVILHGDLNGDAESLDEPIYARPILRPDPRAGSEEERPEVVPPDCLAVDLVHRSVARLFEGDEPAAPETRVIVFAIGDPSQQFDRFVSPLARLIDWLSWKYSALFLISAGNHRGKIDLTPAADLADPLQVQRTVLDALGRDALSRRLLAPAEAVNALTVGAAHDDESDALVPDGLIEPLTDGNLPSVVSPIASGVNRAIKPEILLPGGRQVLRLEPDSVLGNGRSARLAYGRWLPGIRAASPGVEGDNDRYANFTGTSLATALAGHFAGKLLVRIDALREAYPGTFPPPEFDPVLLKAALAHTARWSSARAVIEEVLRDTKGRVRREDVARFLGLGRPQPLAALTADDHKAVLVQASRIRVDEAHEYELPLPPSLSALKERRRLILTLAWISPVRPRHKSYREIGLELSLLGPDKVFGDRTEVDANSSKRGTVLHQVFENHRAIPFGPGERGVVKVSCRSIGDDQSESVPYALFATIETPAELGLPIYEEVRDALRVRPAVGLRPA